MLRTPACRAYLLALVALFVFTNIASAQWIDDSTTNTPVCTLAGSQHTNPAMCSDGANGAIIVWQDTRVNGAMNIFAQRLDASGRALWTANGIRLAAPSGTNAVQENPIIAPDGAGGAYVVWQDLRNTTNGIDLHGQHILSDGSLTGGSAGFAVCSAKLDQINPVICSDGNGGAFVAWTDNRPSIFPKDPPDLYMNHLSGGGAQFGSSGKIVDTAIGTQKGAAICDDGSGGCYIAWADASTLPYAIRANHFSSGGNPYWGQYGYRVYRTDCGTCYSANASHVSINRDGTQLMLAWEVTSVTNSSQNIMATRIRCADPYDSTQVWGHAIDVTGDIPFDQVWPMVFSDDSALDAGADYRGLLVPFEYAWPGAADDWNLTMIRVLGDGSATLPGNGSVYSITTQPHGQVAPKAMQINGSILMVWDDARFGSNPDTCIYAQMIDRSGNRFFPTYRTNSTWGIPICHRSTSSRQVAMAPRTDGAIFAWTDYRAGSTQANIYAQLLLTNGSRSLDVLPPQAVFTSGNDGLCGEQCTTGMVFDTGVNQVGIDSIKVLSLSNMKFTAGTFVSGADSVPFSVCVKDSFQAGSGSIALSDRALNRDTFNVSYCPIPDTSAPYITWDTSGQWISLHLRDDRPWDRGLQSFSITDSSNVYFLPSITFFKAGTNVLTVQAVPVDPTKPSQFYISATDTAGNTGQPVLFSRAVAGVSDNSLPPFSFTVTSGSNPDVFVLRVLGAPSAKITVYDVLGRAIDEFNVQGAYVWNPSGIVGGTYFVVASNGSQRVCRTVVRN